MGRPKQAACNTERDGCPRAFNANEHWKIKNKNNSRTGKKEKQNR